MPWSDGGARRDANLLRIESFGMRTIARVAFLPAPGVGPQSFANPASGPERRTVDFPDGQRDFEALEKRRMAPVRLFPTDLNNSAIRRQSKMWDQTGSA